MKEYNRPSTYLKPLCRSAEENFPWVTKSKLHVSTASAAEKQRISIFAPKGLCLYNILPHHCLAVPQTCLLCSVSEVRPAFRCNHVPACFGQRTQAGNSMSQHRPRERSTSASVLLQEPTLNWDCSSPTLHPIYPTSGCTALMQSSQFVPRAQSQQNGGMAIPGTSNNSLIYAEQYLNESMVMFVLS